MKIIGINGSPRKNKNTGVLLTKALEGASSQGAQTKLVNLYELNYKGCVSCFNCKVKNGASYGKCNYNDELLPVLNEIADADGIILGSPIYFGSITGNMRSFLERLMFPYSAYTQERKSLFKRKIPTGFIYTMNVTPEQMNAMGYTQSLSPTEQALERVFGSFEGLVVNDTYQFDDYSKYVAEIFDETKKAKVKQEQFPTSCKQAFELGVKFATL